jgi:hypothetical protein
MGRTRRRRKLSIARIALGVAEQPIPHGDAQECQWPPTPWWNRRGNKEPGENGAKKRSQRARIDHVIT